MQTAFLQRFNEELCQSYVKGAPVSKSIQTLRDTRFLLDIDPEHPLCYRFNPLIKTRLLERYNALDAEVREPLVSSACIWLTENSFHVDGVITAGHHPHPEVQLGYYLKNLVFWLRSGNLQILYEDHISNNDSKLQSLAQARMAWCWLLNLSGRLVEAEQELKSLMGDASIEEIIQSPRNYTEANCAVAYGIVLSQQKRLSKELVSQLQQLTKHPEVYTSLRATLYNLLAEVELHRFHASKSQHYIELSLETSDELSYEFNYSVSLQIQSRLLYFNSDPQQALSTLNKALSKPWQFPSAVGKAMVAINYGYLQYRTNDREAGYRTCVSESSALLPWMHTDTQFMAYHVLLRESIRHKEYETASKALVFLQQVSNSCGSDRYTAQVVLEQFRLAIILQDQARAEKLASECKLEPHLTDCLKVDTDLDWISQYSWLVSGVFYHRLQENWRAAESLVAQLLQINIANGFSIHFLSISFLAVWLEFESGNIQTAFNKLNGLLSKTSSKDLHLGLFDDIPGSERIVHRALVENHITNASHRRSLIDLGFGVLKS